MKRKNESSVIVTTRFLKRSEKSKNDLKICSFWTFHKLRWFPIICTTSIQNILILAYFFPFLLTKWILKITTLLDKDLESVPCKYEFGQLKLNVYSLCNSILFFALKIVSFLLLTETFRFTVELGLAVNHKHQICRQINLLNELCRAKTTLFFQSNLPIENLPTRYFSFQK
jgi:hypothetical protein